MKDTKRKARVVFIPLIHRPGDEAQVDFFEVTVDEKGVRQKVWIFVMRLMYSGWDFVWLEHRCDPVPFLDGHVRAFAYFQGCPNRLIYDNLAAAVKRILYPGRELSARFHASLIVWMSSTKISLDRSLSSRADLRFTWQ